VLVCLCSLDSITLGIPLGESTTIDIRMLTDYSVWLKYRQQWQTKQNDKEELRKAQNQENSKLPLKSTPPNTLNATSPP
jgi:hypothetical protein